MIRKILRKKESEDEDQGFDVSGLDVKDLIRPNKIVHNKEEVQVNSTFYRALMVEGFPRSISSRFISNILNTEAEMDISLRIDPYSQNRARRKARHQLTKLEKDKKRKSREGRITESIKNRVNDIRNLHEKLDKGEERLFDISVNIATGAKSLEELQKNTEKVKSELNKQQLIPGIPFFKMLKAFKSTLPTTENKLEKYSDNQPRAMPTGAAAELFPFAGNNTSLNMDGILLGTNLETGQPLLVDVFDSKNPNWINIGTSGSGKSFAAKLMVSRYAVQGVETYIIDPHGEYSPVVKNLSGQNIELSIKKGNMINPLDLMGHSFEEKMISIKEFYNILFDNVSKSQLPKLMKATRNIYDKNDIYKSNPDSWDREAPTLKDLLEELKELKQGENDGSQIRSYNALIDQLDPYVHGANNFLDTNTSIDIGSQIINFSIEDLPEQFYPEIMFIVLEFLHSQMKKDRNRKMIVIDEAWQLLSSTVADNSLDQSFVFRTVKSSRKYNLSLGLVVQEIDDLLSSREGRSVLANTSSKLLLKQDRSVASKISNQLQLNDRESLMVKSFQTGKGLFINDEQHVPVEIKASNKEKTLNNTQPKTQSSKTKNKQKQQQTFLEKDMIKEKQLTEKQKQTLQKRSDWKTSMQPLFKGGKSPRHWIKTPSNKTPTHQRLVYGYRNWLKQKFDKIQTTENKADIEIHKQNGQKIGIEIETGTNLKHSKKTLEKKKQKNNETYDDWFIVVTKSELQNKYQKFGETITRTQFKEKIEKL